MKNHEKVERHPKKEKGKGSSLLEGQKAKRSSKREKKHPSYANMINGIEAMENESFNGDFEDQCSRVSVIRTSSFDEEMYQDQPVDFSNKKQIDNVS